VSWAPFALRAARRLTREYAFDCVITTSPPESTHLVGLLLGTSRPAWVADFRDGWTFEPHRERFPARGQRALDGWLERKVATTAEVAIGATLPIAEDLERRLGARASWIPNGVDEDFTHDAQRSPEQAEESAVKLVYTGRLFGPRGSTPEPLLRALVQAESAPNSPQFRLVHAGSLSAAERAMIDRSGAAHLVEHVGFLDRNDVTALQRSAEALVLITSRNSSEATAKVFEYLAAGRPILALAEGNEAARIVDETRTGLTVPPDDVDAIAEALGRIGRGELGRDFSPTGTERYKYPGIAREMAEAVEQAISLGRTP
jgi:glycosyltransferase involved in cell wall biosynthesis